MYRVVATVVTLAGLGIWITPDAAAQGRDRNKITAEEIAEKPQLKNAYELIRNLRPQFLRVRISGDASITQRDPYGSGKVEPAVYLDDTRIPTGVDELRNIASSEILEIRHMRGADALARYGTGHEHGAIFVITNRRRP
ncbi:MAG TPA: hypothetical protein VGA42_08635 [Gemmatimonadales bacterium]|jgi:hypothetical protein